MDIMSRWGVQVVGMGTGVGVIPSPWGRKSLLLAAPYAPPSAASNWGSDSVTLVEPHRPVGVWDGSAIRYVSVGAHTA